MRAVSRKAQPICTHCEKDAGPYITAGIVAARDLETGLTNLSYHRMQVIGDRELRLRLSPSEHQCLHVRGRCPRR